MHILCNYAFCHLPQNFVPIYGALEYLNESCTLMLLPCKIGVAVI